MIQKPILVFDMDDTLYPEQSFVRSALTEVGEFINTIFKVDGAAQILNELSVENRSREIFQECLHQLSVFPEEMSIYEELLQVYRNHRPERLDLHQDFSELMLSISLRYDLALISDGFLPTQPNKFAALRLGEYISKPIFTETLGRHAWKPAPDAFRLVMERFPNRQYIYIGDNPAKDFISPNKLGWTSIQIKRPEGRYFNNLPETSGIPNEVFSDAYEFSEYLSKNYG